MNYRIYYLKTFTNDEKLKIDFNSLKTVFFAFTFTLNYYKWIFSESATPQLVLSKSGNDTLT